MSPLTQAATVTPPVGAHVKNVPGLASLGKPVSRELEWASADGGYAQQFEKGWALIASNGKGGAVYGSGGVVTGPLLPYFESHGYVNAAGWPIGQATSDSYGTWQKFNSSRNSRAGAIMSSSAGTFLLKGGVYNYYVNSNLRSALGSPTGEESRWVSGGGGWAQPFRFGYLTYKASTIKGYVRSEIPFPNISAYGWPTSGSYQQCGGYKVNLQRGYAAQGNRWCPATNYVQPVQGSIVSGKGQNLTSGMNGVKVYLVQQKLGMGYTPMSSTYGPTTISKVKAFQKSRGLAADGIVGPLTFAKLGTGYSFDVDAWKQSSQVPTSATRAQRVNAMVAWAKSQMNKPYIWGGTGPMGFDCSGFMLQAMRAGGVDPRNVSNFTDTRPASDLSNQMWRDGEFQKGSLNSLQVGDFVYYANSSGVVKHVSMYVGNINGVPTVINAVGSKVQYSPLSSNFGWPKKAGVNRAFAN